MMIADFNRAETSALVALGIFSGCLVFQLAAHFVV